MSHDCKANLLLLLVESFAMHLFTESKYLVLAGLSIEKSTNVILLKIMMFN